MRFFKSQKAKELGFILTLLMPILLILGCIVVYTGGNVWAFIFSIVIPILAVLNFVFLVFLLLKKSTRFVFFLLSLIIFFLCFNSFIQFNSEKENDVADAISIITFNAKGFSLKFDISEGKEKEIVSFIKKQNADIVVFQEFSYFSLKYFDMYPHYFLGYREDVTKSLQIVLSKFPIVNQGYIDFPDTVNNAMFADIEYNNEIIRIYNLHLQSFGISIDSELPDSKKIMSIFSKISHSQKTRKHQVQLVKNHIDEFKRKTIICGDFNSTQFSSTYKILKNSRKDTFIETGFGLGTTFQLFKFPLRLDYILPDNDFDVISHQNFDLKLSDHEPILSRLIIKP